MFLLRLFSLITSGTLLRTGRPYFAPSYVHKLCIYFHSNRDVGFIETNNRDFISLWSTGIRRKATNTISSLTNFTLTDSESCSTENTKATNAPNKYCMSLYSGSKVTMMEYSLKILEYSLTHCLTKHATDDLLKLIADILPQPNCATRSNYKQDKFFSNFLKYPIADVHKYCFQCHHLADSLHDTPAVFHNGCNEKFEKFLVCDIEQQIAHLLSGKLFLYFL